MSTIKYAAIAAAIALFVGHPAKAQFTTYTNPNGMGGYTITTPGVARGLPTSTRTGWAAIPPPRRGLARGLPMSTRTGWAAIRQLLPATTHIALTAIAEVQPSAHCLCQRGA